MLVKGVTILGQNAHAFGNQDWIMTQEPQDIGVPNGLGLLS